MLCTCCGGIGEWCFRRNHERVGEPHGFFAFPSVFFTYVVCYVQYWSLLGTQLIIVSVIKKNAVHWSLSSTFLVTSILFVTYVVFTAQGWSHLWLSSFLPKPLTPHSQYLPRWSFKHCERGGCHSENGLMSQRLKLKITERLKFISPGENR